MDEVEQIKRRIDIVELISSYLTLKKAGVNYKAVCPFHQEKTPSFMVSPEKQIWHCFGGCSEGGDIFSFVMKMENLEFPEALRMLAEKAGVKLQRRKSFDSAQDKPDRKSRLYQVNSFAARVFHKILIAHPAGRPALEYLKKRGITTSIIKDFLIGYAPSSRAIAQFLKKQGFSDEEIKTAGNPDRFFKRIIFPIRDVMGNVIAFTGRVLDPKQEPKYLNTPETIIFHKSHILYNLDKARGEIRTKKATIVVEGQMDVLASWQVGVKNVVATSGTALTKDHLEILNRYTPNIIFAFDSDNAGTALTKKAYEMAIEEGMNVKMVSLSQFKDPGEMIAQNSPRVGERQRVEAGPKLWQEAVKEAISVIDWYFNLAFGEKFEILNSKSETELTSQEKKEIAGEILPLLIKIPDTIEQAHYVGLLANRLTISETVIFDALKKTAGTKGTVPFKGTVPIKAEKKNISPPELLIGILLLRPDKIKDTQAEIKQQDFSNPALSAIYKELLKLYNTSKSDLLSLKERKEFLDRLKKNLNRQLQLKIDALFLVVEDLEKTEENLEEDLKLTVDALKTNKKEALKNYYALEIKKAETTRNLPRLKKLIKEFQDAISQ